MQMWFFFFFYTFSPSSIQSLLAQKWIFLVMPVWLNGPCVSVWISQTPTPYCVESQHMLSAHAPVEALAQTLLPRRHGHKETRCCIFVSSALMLFGCVSADMSCGALSDYTVLAKWDHCTLKHAWKHTRRAHRNHTVRSARLDYHYGW